MALMLAAAAFVPSCSSSSSSGQAKSAAGEPPSATPVPLARVGFDVLADEGGYTGKIVVIHDGAVRTLFADGPAAIPLVSPNGAMVAVSTPRGVALLSRTGKAERVIPGTTGCFAGGWVSPRLIAATCSSTPGDWPPAGDVWHVRVVDLNGGGKTIAPSDPGDPPSVDPADRRVSYGWNGKVFTVTAGGSGRRLLVTGTESVTWSHSGTDFAFAPSTNGDPRSIVVEAANGGARHTVATVTWSDDLSIAFSSDDQTIVYSGSADTPHDLWVVPTKGGTGQDMTQASDLGDPQAL